jgi:hypothetical protein
MKVILTKLLLLSRWVRALWNAIDIALSVGADGEFEWVQGDVSHDQSLKAFHGYRCESYGAIVI